VEPSPEVLAQVEEFFGAWKPEGDEPAPAARRAEPIRRRVILVDVPGSDYAVVNVALRLPPRASADLAAERVVAQALQLAFARAALPDGAASARLDGFVDDPLVLGALAVPAARAPATVAAALDAIASLARTPLAPSDVDLARWLEARSAAYAWDTPGGITTTAGELFAQRLLHTALDALPRELARVDGERLRHAAAAATVGREVVVVTGDAARLEPALRAGGFAPEREPEPAAR
jgi:zinc protease